tara:strand:- start:172 stop:765 length:594 start_codon:yes stop_codon:yes gene_type:complete
MNPQHYFFIILQFLFASSLLLILLPLLVLLSLLTRICLGKPILFRQVRTGQYGKSFLIYKFRTMLNGDESDQDRLTRLGKFYRRWSLDELPQLFNILKGDMNVVGPRPLLPEYAHLYTIEQARRLDAKPGVTGWAQVNGRNQISWEEKFELDVWYVNNRSLKLDIYIVFKTLWRAALGSGVQADNHATVERFKGTSK